MEEWDKYIGSYSLISEWREFWERIDAVGDLNHIYNRIHASYSEPHRAYHTLSHIGQCLKELQLVRVAAKKLQKPLALDEIEMAVWLHDIVYDLHRKDNEEKSAEKAFKYAIEIGMPRSFAEKSKQLVLVTKHQAIPTDLASKIVSDIDLSILGMPEDEYEDFEDKIRLEYWKVPEGIYMTERVRILKGFLERPSIYLTDFFKLKYESQARKNLKRTIIRLDRRRD